MSLNGRDELRCEGTLAAGASKTGMDPREDCRLEARRGLEIDSSVGKK